MLIKEVKNTSKSKKTGKTLFTVLSYSADASPPGFSGHGILQVRILEWVAMPFSRGSSRPRDRSTSPTAPALAGGFFTTSATWEAHYSTWGAITICHRPGVLNNGKFISHSSAAATAAKSLRSCPTLWDPIDGLLPGSSVPGILQGRILEWVAISFSNAWKWKVKVKSLSRVRLLATSWTAAYQAPLSMGFSRQEYWRGVPLP